MARGHRDAKVVTMESLSPEDDVYNLWLLLQRLRRVLLKARDQELFKLRVSPVQAGVLYVARQLGTNASLTRISRAMNIEPHTVGGLVKRMESKGLVTRLRDPKRKNTIRVALTEKGDRTYWQSAKNDSVHMILSGLTVEQQNLLWGLSETMIERSLQYIKDAKANRRARSSVESVEAASESDQ
jgi:DNA-binding MarR family transcriptional regulator